MLKEIFERVVISIYHRSKIQFCVHYITKKYSLSNMKDYIEVEITACWSISQEIVKTIMLSKLLQALNGDHLPIRDISYLICFFLLPRKT